MKRIVITGGGGYLGGLLQQHFSDRGEYHLTLISRSPRKDTDILCADISAADQKWTDTLANAYAVIHLAARRGSGTTWSDIQQTNIEGTLNVFEAARRNGARRVIFASTTWVLGGYLGTDTPLSPDLPPMPVGDYGISKMVGESIARHFAKQHGQSVICLRLGRCHAGEDSPDLLSNQKQQYKWLSKRDFCQGIEKAVETEDIEVSLLHLTSEIAGSPWDISATRQELGYSPQDYDSPRAPSFRSKVRRRLGSLKSKTVSYFCSN